MKQIRKRLTYANVMSSIAVFFVLGGGAAFAANELAKNSVGAKQLKKNAVTSAKIKKNAVTTAKIRNGAVTGAKIDSSTLAQVPSAAHAAEAQTAKTLVGRTPISGFVGPGVHELAKVGPFAIQGNCEFDDEGEDFAWLSITTSVDGAVMDDNNGYEEVPFNTGTKAEMFSSDASAGTPEFESASYAGTTAVAPDGTAIVVHSESAGTNILNRANQCYFGMVIQQIG